MGPRGVNAKQEAGRAKKAENAAKKQAAEEAKQKQAESAAWKIGANEKRQSRDAQAALKADEAARKKREKAALLAAEEDALGTSGNAKAKKALQQSAKKNKNKKKDDLSLLEDALQSAADKKVKKKRAEELKKQQAITPKPKPTTSAPDAPIDPLLSNTNAMIGGAGGSDEGDALGVGRNANKQRMEHTSGLDAALDTLDIGGTKPSIMTYAEFEAKMLPVVKEDYSGLRLSQYKEKVFNLWKKSPENPANQQQL